MSADSQIIFAIFMGLFAMCCWIVMRYHFASDEFDDYKPPHTVWDMKRIEVEKN